MIKVFGQIKLWVESCSASLSKLLEYAEAHDERGRRSMVIMERQERSRILVRQQDLGEWVKGVPPDYLGFLWCDTGYGDLPELVEIKMMDGEGEGRYRGIIDCDSSEEIGAIDDFKDHMFHVAYVPIKPLKKNGRWAPLHGPSELPHWCEREVIEGGNMMVHFACGKKARVRDVEWAIRSYDARRCPECLRKVTLDGNCKKA